MHIILIGLGLQLLLLSSATLADSDPKIDIVDLDSNGANQNAYCQSMNCPVYFKSDVKVPKPFQTREYASSYWLATPWYPAANGSCLDSPELSEYYENLINYFQGLNSMGLRLDRTKPIRVVAMKDPTTGAMVCGVRFYIPDLAPIHPPAPVVMKVLVGWDNEKTCYVLGKRGAFTWATITRKYENMMWYLKKLRRTVETGHIVVDIFSGYGTKEDRRYIEILVCKSDNAIE